MRAHVAHDATNERWLLLVLLHHIAGDRTSLEVMHEEMQAYLAGQAERLPAPLPFRNFVAHARLGISEKEHEEFFRRMLGDVDEPTLPFGLVDVQGNGSETEEADLEVESGLARRVRERARKLGVSAASVFHLAWAQVLARVSGREDVVFGTVLFGRLHGGEGSERVVGPFINTLPARIKVGEASVETSIRATHTLLADLLRHEHTPLALAQRCSAVPPSIPLFSALFNYRYSLRVEQAPTANSLPAWQGIERIYMQGHTNYPLVLSVNDLGEGFALIAQAPGHIGPMRICQFMHKALGGLVEALETAPATAARSIDVLPEAERRKVLEEWNDATVEFPSEDCVHELFEQRAECAPGSIAVSCEGLRLTYGALNERANRLAHALRAMGVGPDVIVGIHMDRSLPLVIAILGILKAGGAYLPIDQAYPKERVQFMLEDAGAPVLLTQSQLAASVPDYRGRIICLDDPELSSLPPQSASNPACAARPDNLAYVIYTSGTTGQPKGTLITHRNLRRLFSATEPWYEFNERDVWTLFHSCAFDFSVWEIWGAFLYGGRLVIVPYMTSRSPEEFYRLLAKEQVTVLNQTPSAFRQLIQAEEAVGQKELALRYVIFGGEMLEMQSLRSWFERHGDRKPRLVNMYGITETTVHVTYRPLSKDDLNSGSVIGVPIPDLQVYILDLHRQPAPIGAPGEMYVGGAGVARGYLNRPGLTTERFIPDHLSGRPLSRLYQTGDQARFLPSGEIEYLARIDRQVKIRGYRIELGEIESALCGHAGVREAVVLHERQGKQLVAYVVLSGEPECTTGELRNYLRLKLPDYMIPTAWALLPALPRTPNGKIDRKGLPPPKETDRAVLEYVPPEGEAEKTLAGIWTDILKVERVGRNDNFFELGGHSLLAVTLVERMRRKGLHVDIRALFRTSTLAEFAAGVGSQSCFVEVPPNLIPSHCKAIMPEMLPLVNLSPAEIELIVSNIPCGVANVQDIYPLTPLQEGILFHHLMAKEGDPYLGATLYAFDSQGRLNDYLGALQAVVGRHDVLRTAVLWEGLREPVQAVWRKVTLPVEEVQFGPAGGDVAEQLKARFDPRHHRIDLCQAPLMRILITHDQANERWLLLLLLHHLAGDRTSMEAMQAEIEAYLLGQSNHLPAPVPFRNHVAQARLGASQDEDTEFFRRMLGDVDEPTAPFGLVDVQGDGSEIEEARLEVGEDLARRLRERVRNLGVSAASLCHLAWAQVLARVSGRDDVVFGTVLLGRLHGGEGSDRVVGPFINTLPARIKVGDESVVASIRATHTLLADLLRYEHASLALAQRCSAVPAPAPLFSALFNYRHGLRTERAPTAKSSPAWEGIERLDVQGRTNYPLVLSVNDLGQGFVLTAQAPEQIGPMRICQFMHKALEGLVEALETAPATPARRIDILPEAERHTVLQEWNTTEVDYPLEQMPSRALRSAGA